MTLVIPYPVPPTASLQKMKRGMMTGHGQTAKALRYLACRGTAAPL
jgi:hypothetical protein